MPDKCGIGWADRRTPGSRRGVGHPGGKPRHVCKLDRGHGADTHRCTCGAANANPTPKAGRS